MKLRHRPAKGWYVLIDWRNQRKAKFFGMTKRVKEFREVSERHINVGMGVFDPAWAYDGD